LEKEELLIQRLGYIYKTLATDPVKMDVKTEFNWEKSFREIFGCRRENKERFVLCRLPKTYLPVLLEFAQLRGV
jgi:hypothetical protein